MPETTVPQRIQTSFFCEDAVFDACGVFLAKAYFFRNGSDERADVNTRMRGQEPQIVEVARLERAENETKILDKLAAIYVVSFDDMCAVETYEALRAKAAHYGLLNVEIRALVGMAYPLSWSNAQRSLEMVERALQLGTRQTDPLTRARTRASCLVRRVWVGGWNAQDAEDCKNALNDIRSAGDPLLSAWHTLDCNFMDWCSSKYREAQKSAF